MRDKVAFGKIVTTDHLHEDSQMRLKNIGCWAALAAICTAHALQGQAAGQKPGADAEEERHGSIYCGFNPSTCREEAAERKYADSLRKMLAAYESGAKCTASCRDTVIVLNKSLASASVLIDSLRRIRQTGTAAVASEEAKKASISKQKPAAPKSAVTRTVQPSKRIEVGKEQIARIDSVPYPVFVHDTVTNWRTRYDTVWAERKVTLTDHGGIPWKGLTELAAVAGGGCLVVGAIVNHDWRQPYCINITTISRSH